MVGFSKLGEEVKYIREGLDMDQVIFLEENELKSKRRDELE